MRNLICAVALVVSLATPAHAFSLRKVLGAPFWAVGFTATLVADITIVPMYKGATHYIDAPAIKYW